MSLISSPSCTAHLVSVLTDDLIAKQSALDKLQRAVLRAEGTSQLGLWRAQEVEKRNGVLAADLAQLRKLLHEEKTSSKVTLNWPYMFQLGHHSHLLLCGHLQQDVTSLYMCTYPAHQQPFLNCI